MTALNGSTVLLSILTDDDPSDVYTVIPCQVSSDYTLSVEARDTSCKDSADDTNVPGARSRTMSVEFIASSWPNLAVSPTAVVEIFRKAAETGLQVEGRVVVGGTAKESFVATVTNLQIPAPREGNVTISADLQVSGAMVLVP